MEKALKLLLQTGVYFTLKPQRLQIKTLNSAFILLGLILTRVLNLIMNYAACTLRNSHNLDINQLAKF